MFFDSRRRGKKVCIEWYKKRKRKKKKKQRLWKLITNWVWRVLFKFPIRPKGFCLQLASLSFLHLNEKSKMEYFRKEGDPE
jgi:hypothetical protein